MGYHLKCVNCHKTYAPDHDRYTCDDCGDLKGTLEVVYDYSKLTLSREDFSPYEGLFQFTDLLPVGSNTSIDEAMGGTPLLEFEGLLGLDRVLIKHDGLGFSSSFKDRASIIAVNKALELGYDTVYCASTGNAASSLALASAHTPLKTVIFVPSTIPKGKLAQLLVAGAQVLPIKTTYDEVFDISLEIGRKKGWYCRNSAINPYLLEGKKTAAFEILVQNHYEVPDFVFVSVGDGTIVSALMKGFREFRDLGLVDAIPKVVGVQARGAATIQHVFEKGAPFEPAPEEVSTIADSISVGNPRDVVKACTYAQALGGTFISVSDEAILDSIHEMAASTGVFAEPAGAAAYAGLKTMVASGEIRPEHLVCVVVTGNGLKDIDAVKGQTPVEFYEVAQVYELMKGETE
ncbi:MAG: threonine synthase [delta proteobacterium ML8_F1]|nr:MAG: threonine synthase [delta proteobacterium ML8_F1]